MKRWLTWMGASAALGLCVTAFTIALLEALTAAIH